MKQCKRRGKLSSVSSCAYSFHHLLPWHLPFNRKMMCSTMGIFPLMRVDVHSPAEYWGWFPSAFGYWPCKTVFNCEWHSNTACRICLAKYRKPKQKKAFLLKKKSTKTSVSPGMSSLSALFSNQEKVWTNQLTNTFSWQWPLDGNVTWSL